MTASVFTRRPSGSPLLVCLLFGALLPAAAGAQESFAVGKGQFFLNGKPFRIISGEMHYPRIPKEYWKDRLLKARAMGLNTICTYIFWNAHEARRGSFDFSGDLDVASFIKTAQALGLHVIIRPGPYVCSEWDFGGLPAWLLREPDIRVRCSDHAYMEAVHRYLMRLGRELAGLQIGRGGPIILVQVENEYGSYGNDKVYLAELEAMVREAGFTVPFTTSDGSDITQLEAGALDDAVPAVNFGGGAEGEFANLARYRAGIPPMCGEYWCGWFTHWGSPRWGSADIGTQRADVEWMLKTGKSFNLYMFHGGTNFGFTAGANFTDRYLSDVTSYDYDAPLDEAGRPREKFTVLRDLIRQYTPGVERFPELPLPLPAIDLPPVTPAEKAPLFACLPPPVGSVQPRSMETFGQNSGFIMYRTRLLGPKTGKLVVVEPHDYALVYVNGKFAGVLDRHKGETSLTLPPAGGGEVTLDILVEAMGRVNFGPKLLDRKGITERVELDGVTLMNWSVYPMPMDAGFLRSLTYGEPDPAAGPAFYRSSFTLNQTGDTFLSMEPWHKGVVWVNGHNLGRYWSIGPQQKLFLPGPWLKKGKNEIVVFDLEGGPPRPIRSFTSEGTTAP
jgi:beta-galactosidase